jgi:hypothetical protein
MSTHLQLAPATLAAIAWHIIERCQAWEWM